MKILSEQEKKTQEERVFSVSEFLDFLNSILVPQRVVVQGEIGKKIDRRPTYSIFNLLDKNDHTVLKCFCWQDKLEGLGMELREGLEVRVLGYPKIYKSQYGSNFEFEAEQVLLVGEGVLKEAFDALKKKLEKEGLFALEHKRSLPKFCQKIGLITSKYGKGAKPDFEKHLGNFGFEIYFYDVRVEGMFAINEIVKALHWFNEYMPDLDAIVLIRGGGSWESLQAFNSEEVARAIFGSKIPVISGIGHESDITIADLVADLRSSTPTDAAKILNEHWKLASEKIYEYEKNLVSTINHLFKNTKEKIIFFKENLTYNFTKKIQYLNTDIEEYFTALTKNQKIWQEAIKKLIEGEEQKLNLANPTLKLKQGYSITYNENGKIIKNANDLKVGNEIKTKFYKGKVVSKIKDIKNP